MLMNSDLYFDMGTPHNNNIMMTAVGPNGDPILKVWSKTQNKWIPYDTYVAIDEMLEEHGQAIRNLPDEIGRR